jgi:hypothetical protein
MDLRLAATAADVPDALAAADPGRRLFVDAE